MEEVLVISWWNESKESNVMPVITTHPDPETAEKESERRKKVLGKNSRVILAKVIKKI